MLTKPAAEHFLMPASVYGIDHCTGVHHLAGLDLYRRHSLLPEVPGLVFDSNLVIK
jgi:hypothetical protein